MKMMKLLVLSTLCMAPLAASAHGGESHGGDDLVIAKGTITALSSSAVTIAGKTFILNSSTQYEGMNDQSAVLADFSVGDYAKAKGELDGTDLVAQELELENPEHLNGDDHGKHNSSSSDDVISSRCEFPNMELVRKALERNIKDSLLERNISSKVSVKAKIVDRDSKQVLSATAAINGVSISSSSDDIVVLSGSVAPQACSGVVRLKVKVKGTNTDDGSPVSDSFSQELAIQGLRIVGGKN